MKLDRNENDDGNGKYALINLRRVRALDKLTHEQVRSSIQFLAETGVIDFGSKGSTDEFFVIKLKDKYAEPALVAYANAACDDDLEWAKQVLLLSSVAKHHPDKKTPD